MKSFFWILRPVTNVFADTFDGNAFAGIKLGGGFIERSEQSCFFRNIGLNLLTKRNQFADLANLFFEALIGQDIPHVRFHVFEFSGGSSRMNDQETSAVWPLS